jgi:nucleotide-binding universal stress UspA family protein
VTFGKLLCGIDASEQSMVAVRQAVALAEEGREVLGVISVGPRACDAAGTAALDVMHQLRRESRAAPRHTTDGFPSITPILIRGRDVAALLGGVANLGADLVAVGSHGTYVPPGWCSGASRRRWRTLRAVLGAGRPRVDRRDRSRRRAARGVAEEAVALIQASGLEPVMRIEQGSPHRRVVEVASEVGRR